MAKIHGVIIPKASGSIGNITFRTSGRETVASEKITKNESRTQAQVEQRELFRDAMEVAKLAKPFAKWLYKRRGFKTAFAELSSRCITAYNEEGVSPIRYGFGLVAVEQNKSVVDGDASALRVAYYEQGSDKFCQLVCYASDFEPRKVVYSSQEPYAVTNGALLLNSNANLQDLAISILPIDGHVEEVSQSNLYLSIEMSLPAGAPMPDTTGAPPYHFDQALYVPAIFVNGKKIGISSSINVETSKIEL